MEEDSDGGRDQGWEEKEASDKKVEKTREKVIIRYVLARSSAGDVNEVLHCLANHYAADVVVAAD